MEEGLDRLVAIIEDRVLLDNALRMILEAAETKELPKEAYLPVFHDELTGVNFISILEKVTGKEY